MRIDQKRREKFSNKENISPEKQVKKAQPCKVEQIGNEDKVDTDLFLEKRNVLRPEMVKEQGRNDLKEILADTNSEVTTNSCDNGNWAFKNHMRNQCELQFQLIPDVTGIEPESKRSISNLEVSFISVCLILFILYLHNLHKKSASSYSYGTQHSLRKSYENNSFKIKERTQSLKHGILEGDKVTFSTELRSPFLREGQRWVSVKDFQICAPNTVRIEKGRIGTVSEIEGFLAGKLTFDNKKKEYFTDFLIDEDNFLFQFYPLSD